MILTPLPKKYSTDISKIENPKPIKESVKESSNLLPILIIAGVGLFLMKS